MRYYRSTDKRIKTLSDWPTMLLTFSVCLLCWGTGYMHSIGFPLTKEYAVLPLWDWVCDTFTNKLVVYLAGFLLVMLAGYIIQRISDIEMLIRERTRLPLLFFVLLVSTNVGLFPLKEVAIVLLCLVFVVYELFGSYQLPEATGKLFNAGVSIGFASLFMPQVLWFMPLLWIGMYQFRSLSLKSWFASLVGTLIIYWFALAWCVWRHDFSIYSSFFHSLVDFQFFSIATSFQYYQISFVAVVFLLIVAFFHIKMDAFNNSVRVRQMLSFLLNMSVWALALTFLYGKTIDSFFTILYLPGTVVIAYFFENMRMRIRFFLYYFVLLLCVFSFIMRVWNF